MYLNIRLRHKVSHDTILNHVARPYHLSLYVANLQNSEEPVKGSFFVYSHRAFASSPALGAAMANALSAMTEKPIVFSLYWGSVNMNKAGIIGPVAL